MSTAAADLAPFPEPVVYPTETAWLQARAQCLTGTDAPLLAGVSRRGGRLTVFNRKTGITEPVNDAMVIGRALQGGVIAAYHELRAKKTGEHLEIKHAPPHSLYVSSRDPHYAASLDALQRIDGTEWHPLEVKTTASFPAEPFDEWVVQLMWQLLCVGAKRGTLAALCGGQDLQFWDLERNDDMIEQLVRLAEAFRKNFLSLAVAPPPDGPGDALAVRRLYAESTPGLEVNFAHEELELATRLIAAKEALAEAELRKDYLQAELQARMGLAEVAYLPNGYKLSWKNQTRSSYVVPATRTRVFRIERPRGLRSA